MIDPMPLKDAAYYAESMNDLQRDIVRQLKAGGFSYMALADIIGAPYEDVRQAGHTLQSMSLAQVSPARVGNEYNGSAIRLNKRGQQVRLAIETMLG